MNFLELLKRGNLIAAHRGASSIAPENTLRALRLSVGHADFIEIDVQLSSDGVAVVFHDDTLERTTNMDKVKSVAELSFDELSKLDYGSWFDGKPEPVLTLKETLEFIKEKSLFLNIEIKNIHHFFNDEDVVKTVLDEVKRYGVETQVIISSFREQYLPICKKILPDIATALLVYKNHPNNLIEYLKELKVDGYNMNNEMVDFNVVSKLKGTGFFIGVYTVDDKQRIEELFDIGVDAVFSNKLHKN